MFCKRIAERMGIRLVGKVCYRDSGLVGGDRKTDARINLAVEPKPACSGDRFVATSRSSLYSFFHSYLVLARQNGSD